MQPIRHNDQTKQVIEELQKQLMVTETILLKVLQKVGPLEITADELAAEVSETLMIDMSLDEKEEVWTFSLKEGSE